MSENKWCYSTDKENYTGIFDTKEEAIKEGKIDAIDRDKKHFYIAKAIKDFTPCIDTDFIIELIQEDAYNNGGEWAEDYLDDISKEQLAELDKKLNDVLSDWLNKHNLKPTWFTVEDVEEISLEANEND